MRVTPPKTMHSLRAAPAAAVRSAAPPRRQPQRACTAGWSTFPPPHSAAPMFPLPLQAAPLALLPCGCPTADRGQGLLFVQGLGAVPLSRTPKLWQSRVACLQVQTSGACLGMLVNSYLGPCRVSARKTTPAQAVFSGVLGAQARSSLARAVTVAHAQYALASLIALRRCNTSNSVKHGDDMTGRCAGASYPASTACTSCRVSRAPDAPSLLPLLLRAHAHARPQRLRPTAGAAEAVLRPLPLQHLHRPDNPLQQGLPLLLLPPTSAAASTSAAAAATLPLTAAARQATNRQRTTAVGLAASKASAAAHASCCRSDSTRQATKLRRTRSPCENASAACKHSVCAAARSRQAAKAAQSSCLLESVFAASSSRPDCPQLHAEGAPGANCCTLPPRC